MQKVAKLCNNVTQLLQKLKQIFKILYLNVRVVNDCKPITQRIGNNHNCFLNSL